MYPGSCRDPISVPLPCAMPVHPSLAEPHCPRVLQSSKALGHGYLFLPGVAGVLVGHPFDTVKVSLLCRERQAGTGLRGF